MNKIELNEKIAEKFMGLNLEERKRADGQTYKIVWDKEKEIDYEIPDYTADSEWGKVVAKLVEQRYGNYKYPPALELCTIGSGEYICTTYWCSYAMKEKDEFWSGTGDTPGEAVCRAAVAYLDATKEGK